MNAKKIMAAAALLVLITAGAFAWGPGNGCGGNGPEGRGHGFFGMPGFFYPGDKKIETVTGTVLAEKEKIPLLKTGKEEYILVFPWFLMDELNLGSAGQITVTGYVSPSVISGSSQKILFARTLTIGDKTWDVQELMKDRGPGPGRGRGRGGYCRDYDDDDQDFLAPDDDQSDRGSRRGRRRQ